MPSSRLVSTWVPLLLWVGLIFFLSSRSSFPEPTVPVSQYTSILAHFMEYAVLAALAYRTARTLQPHHWSRVTVLAFGLGVALLDEAFQSTVPGRVSEVADVMTDMGGTLVPLLLIEGWRRARRVPETSGS